VKLKVLIAPIVVLVASQWGCNDVPDEATQSPQAEAVAASQGSMLDLKINLAGFAQSAIPGGAIDQSNPFFQSLGVNGRTCNSCHQAGEGWTVTPIGVTLRFLLSQGTDPIFLPHDGANAPGLDVSTPEARWNAYSMLRSRAVIRIGLPVKDTSEFELVTADDPYGFASATQLSLFRRPLPTTNLRFLGAINWDGRSTPATDLTNIHLGLKNQSNGATVNHAQAPMPIADDVREAIVNFETSLTTAQVFTWSAQSLSSKGATGGPFPLLTQDFTLGVTSPGSTFTTFAAWADLSGTGVNDRRRHVAAGEDIFNNRTFTVTTAAGSFAGTCSGCHNTPNVGGTSSFRLFDVGIADPARRSPSVPLYTFRNKATQETIQTTDPGRALITGLWADMNKFKVPGLRGLSARPPYFHDGSVATLDDVVDHYDHHFNIGFSAREKKDLVAFLESL
jgi:cytochrome c peroxidase